MDARDEYGKWFAGTIVKLGKKKVLVHFDEWSALWDTWYSCNSFDLARFGTISRSREDYRNDSGYVSVENQERDTTRGRSNLAGTPIAEGVTGLYNLGNTCFMNSTLQCLSHTRPLTQYFITGEYKSDINKSNPLGLGGRLAIEYAGLLQELWSGKYSAVAPTKFRSALCKFAPRFSGFQQHDSQELLGFLLDGLHEDLNRIRDKPYTQVVEGGDLPDDQVAEQAWETHQLRNQSVIVDLLQGQFKSTIICPEENCSQISITFDPFMFLSLPFPTSNTCSITVRLVRYLERGSPENWSVPIIYGIECNKHGSILNLKQTLSNLTGIPLSRLVIADVFYHRVFRTLTNDRKLSEIRPGDIIFAYQVSQKADVAIQLMHRCLVKNPNYRNGDKYSRPVRVQLIDTPILVSIQSERTTYAELRQEAYMLVSRWLKNPINTQNSALDDGTCTENSDVVHQESVDLINEPQDQCVKSYYQEEDPAQKLGYPFRLCIVNQAGTSCGLCAHVDCLGCLLPDTDELVNIPDKSHIAFEWINPDNEFVFSLPLLFISLFLFKDTQNETPPFFSFCSMIYDSPKDYERHSSAPKSSEESSGHVTLSSLFDSFTKAETLSPDDLWFCSKCQEFRFSNLVFIYSTQSLSIFEM